MLGTKVQTLTCQFNFYIKYVIKAWHSQKWKSLHYNKCTNKCHEWWDEWFICLNHCTKPI